MEQNFGSRESMAYDVVIVGGGPAGLSAAIRFKRMANLAGLDASVCVVEKGAELGAHIISGAIVDPCALDELIPDWKKLGAPLKVPVSEEHFLFLTETGASRTPNWLLPDCFANKGLFVGSLGNLVRWLGSQAEAIGVDIFPGFAATDILYREDGAVMGIATGDMGLDRSGKPKPSFQRGIELHAKYTLFAEGARGHLGRRLTERFRLDSKRDPQSYSLGFKELWEIDPSRHRPGLVLHAAGWPLDAGTYGGGFLYHLENNQVAVGMFVGLDYQNPYLSPFEEFQRFKTHPAIRRHIEGSKRVAYGARAAATGGLQALPELAFPGGALIGCNAGFMNSARLKGIHTAMKSGMLAAEAAFGALIAERSNDVLAVYTQAFRQSWLLDELHRARNVKPWMSKGLYLGAAMVGIDQLLFGGKLPWTLGRRRADHECLRPAAQSQPSAYPRPDNTLTFDLMSSVYLSNTMHEENQPCHLTLRDDTVPVAINLAHYAGPEARYCPAGVYEFVKTRDGADRLQINAANCVHCKTCDIKDPTQNIVWVAPEGGGGPNYPNM